MSDIKEGMTVRPVVIPSSHTVRVRVDEVYRDTCLDSDIDIEEWAETRLRQIKTNYTGLICDEETLSRIKLEIEQVAQTIFAHTGFMPTWTLKVNMSDDTINIRKALLSISKEMLTFGDAFIPVDGFRRRNVHHDLEEENNKLPERPAVWSDMVEDHAAFTAVLDTGFDASKIPAKDTNMSIIKNSATTTTHKMTNEMFLKLVAVDLGVSPEDVVVKPIISMPTHDAFDRQISGTPTVSGYDVTVTKRQAGQAVGSHGYDRDD